MTKRQRDEASSDIWERLDKANAAFCEVNAAQLQQATEIHAGNMITLTFKGIQGVYAVGKGWCVVTTAVFPDGTTVPHYNVVMDTQAPAGGFDSNFPKKWGSFPKMWRAIGWKEKDFISQTGEIICSNFSAYVIIRPCALTDQDVCCIFNVTTPLGTRLTDSIASWVVSVKKVSPFGNGRLDNDGKKINGRLVVFEHQGNEYELAQYKTKNYDAKNIEGTTALLIGIKELNDKFVNSSCCQFITEENMVKLAGREFWERLCRCGQQVQSTVTATDDMF